MRKLLLILALVMLLPVNAWAGIYSGTVGEIRTTGSDTNGGGFSAGVTAISSKTDLAVAAGSNVQVSSATYGFTSADIGRWLTVTAGTGWNLGSYQILSVTAGVATLSKSPAPVSTISGSFTIYYGLDYSQKNAKNTSGNNISTTDAVTNGTTTITSATAAFTSDIVGNVIYIAGGTGAITGGWYQVVTYTNATTIVVDRSTGLTTGTGATMNIGGAYATWLNAYTALGAVKFYVKNTGTYVITSGITVNGNWIGYTTTRGDNGKTTLQASTTSNMIMLTMNGGENSLNNFIFDCNNLSNCSGVNLSGYWGNATNIKVINYTGSYGISSLTTELTNCEITSGSGSGNALVIGPATGYVSGCYIHDTATNGISGAGGIITNNIIANITGSTNSGINLGANSPAVATNNTIYNTAGDCIKLSDASQQINMTIVTGNLLVSCGGYGLNATGGAYFSSPFLDGNAYYATTSGNRHLMDDITMSTNVSNGASPYTNIYDVSLSANPFVNAAGGNFSLNTTTGGGANARGASVPQSWPNLVTTSSNPSIGAVQPQTTTISGGSYAFGQ